MDEAERIARIQQRAKEDAPPNNYRVFWLDHVGKIIGCDIISAADDAAALELAMEMKGANPGELWDRDRMIARLP